MGSPSPLLRAVVVLLAAPAAAAPSVAARFIQAHQEDLFTNKADFPAAKYIFGELAKRGLCGNLTLIDGGLNQGQYAEVMLDACPGAALHGFEVQAAAAAAAEQRLARFGVGSRVHVHNVGWGEERATLAVNIVSKLAKAKRGQRGASHEGAHLAPGAVKHQTTTGHVDVVPLADWTRDDARTIDYLAIDVEGFEGRVLRGMRLDDPANRARFAAFQYELGGTWCDPTRNFGEPWSQRKAAEHLAGLGYDLFLVGTTGFLPVTPAAFGPPAEGGAGRFYPGSAKQGQGACHWIQGNVLALNAHARPELRAAVLARPLPPS